MAFWCQGKIFGTGTDLLTTFKIHGQRKYLTSVNLHAEMERRNRAVYARLIESKMINLPSPDIGIMSLTTKPSSVKTEMINPVCFNDMPLNGGAMKRSVISCIDVRYL
jgi:hypothetical protein